MLRTYEDFTALVEELGFLTLSNNPLGWPNVSALTAPGQWHTGLPDDPWQWKVRVVEERRAAYAKLFFGLPSFIAPEWYPLFLAARRGGRSFEDAWETGTMSTEARRIYDLFGERKVLAVHEIKRLGGFTGSSAGKYETAMTALQTGMFLTVSGMTRMTTLDGRVHSWPVTEYMRVEDWAWEGTAERALRIDAREASERIGRKIAETTARTDGPRVRRFIHG